MKMKFGVQICENFDVEVLKTDRKVRIDVILKKVLVLGIFNVFCCMLSDRIVRNPPECLG